MVRRVLGSVTLVGLVLVLLPPPARADLTGPCTGLVRIDGIEYGPDNDSAGDPAVIPDRDDVRIRHRGSTNFPITDHHGEMGVGLGPFTLPVVDWGGENATNLRRTRGTFDLQQAYDELPFPIVGIYEVSGFHEGQGRGRTVRCEGFAIVKIEGNPFGTVLGISATILTVLALAGLVLAGVASGLGGRFPGRPGVGAVVGLLFGLFVGMDLQQWGIRPLDDLSFFGLPIIGLLIGLGMALWGPFGQRPPSIPSARHTSAADAIAGTVPPVSRGVTRPRPPARTPGEQVKARGTPQPEPERPEPPPEHRPPPELDHTGQDRPAPGL